MATKIKTAIIDLINVIQITDTHILNETATTFNDFDTSASLVQVIKKIQTDETNATLILLTGDLVHQATKISYQKLVEYLSILTIPVFFLPGNHDVPNMMDDIMSSNGHDASKVIDAGKWLIILLNSCVIGEHRGELSDVELDFLRKTLESNSKKYCLIALHHHPVSIDSTWMDEMALSNAESFFNIVDDFENVRTIIWGHIHQEFAILRNGVTLLGTPSTCLQFKPKSDTFAIDEKSPAYRKIELKSNGEISSKVIYLEK